MALWSGRFEKGVSAFTQEFGASLPTDTSMYDQDIRGSLAHAKMLAAQGVISDEDYAAIERGISHIKSQMDEGAFAFDVNDEDIHMDGLSPTSVRRARACTPAVPATTRSRPIYVCTPRMP